MEVKLNDTLTTHLSEYNTQSAVSSTYRPAQGPQRDYTLPPTSAPSKRTCTLGKPIDLLPVSIVPKQQQEWAVAQINANPCEHRTIVWRKPQQGIVAITAHFESVWWAWWKAPDKTYMYGCTVMLKDNATARSKVFENGRWRILRSINSG